MSKSMEEIILQKVAHEEDGSEYTLTCMALPAPDKFPLWLTG
jgi:hypothetical protein